MGLNQSQDVTRRTGTGNSTSDECGKSGDEEHIEQLGSEFRNQSRYNLYYRTNYFRAPSSRAGLSIYPRFL